MKVTEGKSKGLTKEYKAVIPAADFESAVDARLARIASSAKLDGFRPGKAPKALIAQKYRSSVLGEVLDDLVRDGTDQLIADNKLRPAVAPDVKLTKFEDGKDIEFEVTVEVLPEIKLGDFSKLTLEKLTAEVPAEEVDKAVRYVAESHKEQIKIEEDRAAVKGDIAVIDFTGSVDGEEFQGGKGESYPLELGSGAFIPGFEDQIIGKKAGDEFDVNVRFPADYHAKALADKDAVFAVKLKELRIYKEVVIDDAFAKTLGEESLDALKAKVVERIKADYNRVSRLKLKRALLDALDKEYNFEVPQKLIDAEYNGIVKQYENAKKRGQLDEDEKNRDEKDVLAEYKDIALRRVKLGLLLSEAGSQAEIKITQEDINRAIMEEARNYPGQEKAVFDYYLKNKQAVEALKAPVFEEKIVDHILSKATLNEKVISVEELYNFEDDAKPAKKSKKK